MFFISNIHNDAEATNTTGFASLVTVTYIGNWLKTAFQKTVCVRAIKVTLVVGATLPSSTTVTPYFKALFRRKHCFK